MRVLSLFSGVGGLDLGVKLALPEARVVGYVEKDDYCRKILTARMRDGWLDEAPIYDDIRTFNGDDWRGRVDLVCGGFPCQDVSGAGEREGLREGNRSGLWLEFVRVIRQVDPRYVFVENVSGLLVRGMGAVLGELASLRFNAEWGMLSACSVGGSHMRHRVFILAYAASIGQPDDLCGHYSTPKGIHGQKAKRGQDRQQPALGTEIAVGLREREWGPDQPGLARLAHGVADQVDRARTAGNGVVPLVAAHALRSLTARIADYDL